MITADNPGRRHIRLKGACNFRDLGGYPASGGKFTKWGRLYRSDNLSNLTRKDLRHFEKLNIRSLVDLRSGDERSSRPNRLPENSGIRFTNLAISDYAQSYDALKKDILFGRSSDIEIERMMHRAYREGITDYRDELKRFLETLLDPENYPVLVMCNAGKDRTGVASALALMALGVTRSTVMEDYLLSGMFLQPMIARLVRMARLRSLFRANIGHLKMVLDTRTEYLQTTFTAIDQAYGSTESYLNALGIGEDSRQLLRSILCR